MAQRSQSHPDNVPGSFFVDRTCIDCGTCYEYLPWVFQDAGLQLMEPIQVRAGVILKHFERVAKERSGCAGKG